MEDNIPEADFLLPAAPAPKPAATKSVANAFTPLYDDPNEDNIGEDDFYAVPKAEMPGQMRAAVTGAARNIIPSLVGLGTGAVGGLGGAAVGGPAAPVTGFIGAATAGAAGAYGAAEAQNALVPPGLREQLAAMQNPGTYSWAGMIPGFATGKFINPKSLLTKAGAIEFGTEFGAELGTDAVVNALTGQEQNVGQSVGMAAAEAVLQGRQTGLGRTISQAPYNLGSYLLNPKPAAVAPDVQARLLAEAQAAPVPVAPAAPVEAPAPVAAAPVVLPQLAPQAQPAPVAAPLPVPQVAVPQPAPAPVAQPVIPQLAPPPQPPAPAPIAPEPVAFPAPVVQTPPTPKAEPVPQVAAPKVEAVAPQAEAPVVQPTPVPQPTQAPQGQEAVAPATPRPTQEAPLVEPASTEGAAIKQTDNIPVGKVLTSEIKADPKLMQYKATDEAESGVNQKDKLTGTWDETKGGVLVVWQPKDPAAVGLAPGQKYIVANGHHRLDFAKRAGRKALNVQVLKESDGWSSLDARMQAAEINIADGKGSPQDAVKYLQAIQEKDGDAAMEAAAKRVSSNEGARRNVEIAKGLKGDALSLFINEKIEPKQAHAIALHSPGNEVIQNAGAKAAVKGMSPESIVDVMNTIKDMMGERAKMQADAQNQGTLWNGLGMDDAALQDMAEKLAIKVAEKRSAIDDQLRAVQGAAKRPDKAGAGGVVVKNVEKTKKHIEDLKVQRDALSRWRSDPATRDQIYAEAGVSKDEEARANGGNPVVKPVDPATKSFDEMTPDEQKQHLKDNDTATGSLFEANEGYQPDLFGPKQVELRLDATGNVVSVTPAAGADATPTPAQKARKQKAVQQAQKIAANPATPAQAGSPTIDTVHLVDIDGQTSNVIEHAVVDKVRSGVEFVKTPADMAHTVSEWLNARAQENFAIVILDKDGRVLDVARSTIGGPNYAEYLPAILAGQGLSVKGGAKAWLVHNHPSMTDELSTGDVSVSNHFDHIIKGTGIEYEGIIAIAGDKFAYLDKNNKHHRGKAIPQMARNFEAPITERIFTQHGKLLDVAISGSISMADAGSKLLGDKPGILLLNTRNNPVGVIPMTKDQMLKLRQPGALDNLLRAVDRTNAIGFGVYLGDGMDAADASAITDNMTKLQNALQVKHSKLNLFDVVNKAGDNFVSSNGYGADFNSVRDDAQAKTKAQLVSEANRVFAAINPNSKAEAFDTPLYEYELEASLLTDAGDAEDQILQIARQVEAADPAVAQALRNIVNPPIDTSNLIPPEPRNTDRDARKADDLDARIKQNAKNRTGDPDVRRGYQGIVDRALLEARKNGRVSEKEIEGLTRILNMVGKQFLGGVKLSIREGQANQMGQYESMDSIVTIFKDAILNGRFEDTAAHEIAHHLAQFLPEADRVSLRNEWQAARNKFLKDNPGFAKLVGDATGDWNKVRIKGTDLQAMAEQHPELKGKGYFSQIPGKGEPMYRVKATDETYRLFNSNEWFAETFKDVVRKRLDSDPVYTQNPNTWKDKLVQLWEGIKTQFRQMFGKDQAARILSNFAKGRYSPEEYATSDIDRPGRTPAGKPQVDVQLSVNEDAALAALPKEPITEANGEQVLNSILDASTEGNPDADLIPKPKPGQSVQRTAWDIASGRYFSGLSAKAHQNADRNADSATVKRVANIIHARPGTKSDAFERDMPTAIATKRTEFQNRFNAAMAPLKGMLGGFRDSDAGTAKQQRETVYRALTDMITGRKDITPGDLGKAAQSLKDLLADLHAYRTEAGDVLGNVKDYYPAVYDSLRIGESREAFVKDATKAYEIELNKLSDDDLAKEAGVMPDDLQTPLPGFPGFDRKTLIDGIAKAKAEALHHNHLFGGDGDFGSVFGEAKRAGAENPSDSRVFSKEAQAIMAKWQVADPFHVVTRYIGNSVKRSEIVRRFGADGKKWGEMREAMLADGVDANTVEEMRQLVRLAAGVGIPPRGRTAQGVLDSVTMLTAASAMGRGFLNNLVEPVSMGIRTGSPGTMFRAYGETWARFLREVPNLSPAIKAKLGDTFWQQYGETIGTIHNSIEDAWMTNHSMDIDADQANPAMRWLTNRIYKANLMDASENAKQQASHAIGYGFIKDLAKWSKGEHWMNKAFGVNPKQSVADQLNELGVPPEKHAEFSDWVLTLDKAKGDDLMAKMTENSEMAALHREAMTRFSYQSSVRSSRAHRPVFQDDMFGKTLLQLMNFSYSYAAEVNSRVYDMAKQGVMPSPDGKQYNAADRVRLLGPAAGALFAIAAYRGLLELKDLLYPTESTEKRAKDPAVLKWANAASYAGVFGPKIEQAMKYIKRDQVPGGPAGQIVRNAGRAATSALDAVAEGKDFSTAGKQAVKAAIPLIKGGVVAGASAANPVLGAAAVQATNTTGWANKLSNAAEGDKDKGKGGGYTPKNYNK